MNATYTFDENIISDLHKDAYGFRPCQGFWASWDSMDDDEKQAEWDSLIEACNRAIQEEEEQQARAITRFEALVQKTIETGAGNRETALAWIIDACPSARGNDWDFLCWEHGLPYGYFRTK
jgi:hypothetical protein